jgi:6-phosphogluconolactonase
MQSQHLVRTLWALGVAGMLASCSAPESSDRSTPSVTVPDSQANLAQDVFNSKARHRHFVYVPLEGGSASTNGIDGFAIKATTGALTEVEGSPFGGGTSHDSFVAVNPKGTVVYVSSNSNQTPSIYAFQINKRSGVLTQIPGSPFAESTNGWGMAFDPNGKFLYVADWENNTVSGYAVNAASGALTEVTGSPFAAGANPYAAEVSPDGKFLYVNNMTLSYSPVASVSAYKINAASGALTSIKGSPFATDGVSAQRGTVAPGGEFLYVVNAGTTHSVGGSVAVYKINKSSGKLSQIAGSPFATGGSFSEGVAIDPNGNFAYVTNNNDGPPGDITGFQINKSSGALSQIAGSPFAAGISPAGIAVDRDGSFAYVADTSSANISGYAIDASSGALTPVTGSPFGTGYSSAPTDVGITP